MKKLLPFIALVLSLSVRSQNTLLIPDTLSGDSIHLTLQNGTHQFFAGVTTNTMGANGNLLGPTLLLKKNQFVNFSVENQIGESTTIHWHGMHVSPINDGGPHTIIDTGMIWRPSFEVLDKAGLYWYHPHLHGQTDKHVSKGIAGMIIVQDQEEGVLTLPRTYGVDDFPLVIQTKGFDASGQILVHTEADSTVMVNGTVDPFLDIPAQVVRFRVLNGSSQRVYNLGFEGNLPFKIIGTDGGLLTAPVTKTRYKIIPGQRVDILLDASSLQGQTVHLKSFASELPNAIYGAAQEGMMAGATIPGYDANPLNGSDFNILQLTVNAATANPITTIPSTLASFTRISQFDATETRSLTFSTTGGITGPFRINGSSFNMNVINYEVPLGNTEIWSLTNQTPIGHPFHIHDVQFFILDINGIAPPAELQGYNDVVFVPAGMGNVRFIAKFENHSDSTVPYMYHCHMLTHEDDGMMGQFLVLDTAQVVDTVVGGVSIVDEEFTIFPNPARNIVSIRMNKITADAVRIYSLKGELLIDEKVTGKNTVIGISDLNAGLYIINISGIDGISYRRMLSVTR